MRYAKVCKALGLGRELLDERCGGVHVGKRLELFVMVLVLCCWVTQVTCHHRAQNIVVDVCSNTTQLVPESHGSSARLPRAMPSTCLQPHTGPQPAQSAPAAAPLAQHGAAQHRRPEQCSHRQQAGHCPQPVRVARLAAAAVCCLSAPPTHVPPVYVEIVEVDEIVCQSAHR